MSEPRAGETNNKNKNNSSSGHSKKNERRRGGERGGGRTENIGSNTVPSAAEDQEQSQERTNQKSRSNSGRGRMQTDRHRHRTGNNNNSNTRGNRDQDTNNKTPDYPSHLSYETCLERYNNNNNTLVEPSIIVRGKLRVLPFSNNGDAISFVACDQGRFDVDICIPSVLERNRAMHGDTVFVEILEDQQDNTNKAADSLPIETLTIQEHHTTKTMDPEELEAGDEIYETWQDDSLQMDLWNPVVSNIIKPTKLKKQQQQDDLDYQGAADRLTNQRKGRVVYIFPPTSIQSELDPHNTSTRAPNRRIVGTLMTIGSGTILLTPNNKSLPQFKCPPTSTLALINQLQTDQEDFDLERTLFKAEYKYNSWDTSHKWPPCINIERLGEMFVMEDEIQALLTEFDVDHGDFGANVLKQVDDAVQSGLYHDPVTGEMGWKPTPEMYKDRRDYRDERIFTIDPTTAKDLDDALHIKQLADGRVEVGVHIADVSFFVRPDTDVDKEALRRSTTVYLVDRTVPMLPRPLCEIACSLNENVERLAFSCVWTMNMDGTLRSKDGTSSKAKIEDVWYGRTVIRSCARLDYATAQNIIDGTVATGEAEKDMNDKLWPTSRRPASGHTVDQVAADVRLLHKVGMARRKLRFDNGALALHGIKLTFTLEEDGQTPLLAAPYPIRDSNRLVEEYMLLANYLVAQRLITHTGDLALLRCHSDPTMEGLDDVVRIAKTVMNFDIDTSSSQSLHDSLIRFSRVCDSLLLQCFTNLLMTPMQAAEYFAAGTRSSEEWRHYALNIPYYTHFTSPIRRYPDVMVHRLLQASIDGKAAVENFPADVKRLERICVNGNVKKKASKDAQERCDRVFLSLFLHKHPKHSELGVVISVGKSTFDVYLPSIGVNAKLFLPEHKDLLTYASEENEEDGSKRILLQQKPEAKTGDQWKTLEIVVFTKLSVSILCRDRPPVDIRLRLEGPWKGDET